jgi:predicted enzyme related to lactoylglutathione lyase
MEALPGGTLLVEGLESAYKRFTEAVLAVSSRVAQKDPELADTYLDAVSTAAGRLTSQVSDVEGWAYRIVNDAKPYARSITTPGGSVVTSLWEYNSTTDSYEITFREKGQSR